MYYYGARYYDSGIGRFTSLDPWFGDLSDPQSLNKYSYVRNNPLKYVDPSGNIAFLAPALPVIVPALTATAKLGAAALGGLVAGKIMSDVANPSPPRIVDEVPAQSPANNTAHDTPVIQTPTNIVDEVPMSPVSTHTGGDVTPQYGLNILTTPAYSPSSSGVCGGNMSCATTYGPGKPFSEADKDLIRERDGNTCVFCGTRTTDQSGPKRSEIDHSMPKSRGGNNTLENGQNTCRTCNRQKGNKTSDEYREWKSD